MRREEECVVERVAVFADKTHRYFGRVLSADFKTKPDLQSESAVDSTPTKTPQQLPGILTPSCDITPTREARDDDAYADFASSPTQDDRALALLDGAASSPAAAGLRARRGEPSSDSLPEGRSPGSAAAAAGGFGSIDPFPGIPAPTPADEATEARQYEDAGAEEDDFDVDSILDAILGEEETSRTPSPPALNREGEAWADVARLRRKVASLTRLQDAVDRSLDADRACAQRLRADALEVRKLKRALDGLRQHHRAFGKRDANERQVRSLIAAEREQRALLEEATLREAAAYERGVNDAERALLAPTARQQVRTARRERFATSFFDAVNRACFRALCAGAFVGGAVYYFDGDFEVRVPAHVAHHLGLAFAHVELALS